MNKQYYIYILTNKRNNVLYTGVTNDLQRRVYEHREKLVGGFTKKYNVNKLVYYEETESIEAALNREKQIKGGSRQKKIDLIEGMNPQWRDLFDEILEWSDLDIIILEMPWITATLNSGIASPTNTGQASQAPRNDS